MIQPKKVCKNVSLEVDRLVVEGLTNRAESTIQHIVEIDKANDPPFEYESTRGALVEFISTKRLARAELAKRNER